MSVRHPYDVPRMRALSADHIKPPKLDMRKTEYTDLFDGRSHHPHHDATQHKVVNVRYLPKLPQFQLPPVKRTRADREKVFQRALFRDGKPLREDLSLPRVEIPRAELAGGVAASTAADVSLTIDSQLGRNNQQPITSKSN